jgi:hypothetical protein
MHLFLTILAGLTMSISLPPSSAAGTLRSPAVFRTQARIVPPTRSHKVSASVSVRVRRQPRRITKDRVQRESKAARKHLRTTKDTRMRPHNTYLGQ